MGNTTLKVRLLRSTGSPEELIAMAAKLCYSGAELKDLEEGIKAKDQTAFLNKLMDLGHLSTVEHASFTFGIEGVSRALLAQITRHRLASFSVQSQRYVSKKKENGDTFQYIIPDSIKALGEDEVRIFEEQMQTIQGWYNTWVEKLGGSGESANEDARFVLPNASETKFMLTMNARELRHFFSLRCCNRAQWEIRALAEEMVKLVKQEAPILFHTVGPDCVTTGKCSEGKMTCGKMNEVVSYYKSL